MIDREEQDGVVVLRLAHGKASALDLELAQELAQVFRGLEEDDTRACVLTGTGGIFSAGVDLKRMLDGGEAYVRAFVPALVEAFRELFFFSKPLVGACNGHAIAGGCVMLACCDLRLAARGRGRVGVPELLVGVPFPLLALEILRDRLPPQHLQRLVLTGETFGVETALALGLCDELVEAEQLEARALDAARALAAVPPTSYSATKRLLRRPVCERLRQDGERDDQETTDLWASEEVTAALAAYVERTLRR